MKSKAFKLHTEYEPAGDQPDAIASLVAGVKDGLAHQTLLGVTGSGKTFTMANVIQEIQRPTLVLCHNKTLAAQLYGEFKLFFPIMPLNILFPTMIIINLRPTFLLRIPLSKKMLPSMNM